jgi:glutamyl-tRNA synthetase
MADYRDRGFLPEAMVNYLALLGWGPPDGVEVRPIAEIVDLYRLEDVNPSPAFFDLKKLSHVNAEWIRRLDPEDFIARAIPFLPAGDGPVEALRALAPLIQERVRTLDEVAGMVEFLHVDEPTMDEASWEKAMVKGKAVTEMLDAAIAELSAAPWDADGIRLAVEAAATTAGLVNAEGRPQLSKAQGPVRVAVSGRSVGPPLFESLEHLGRERTLHRLQVARDRIS